MENNKKEININELDKISGGAGESVTSGNSFFERLLSIFGIRSGNNAIATNEYANQNDSIAGNKAGSTHSSINKVSFFSGENEDKWVK